MYLTALLGFLGGVFTVIFLEIRGLQALFEPVRQLVGGLFGGT